MDVRIIQTLGSFDYFSCFPVFFCLTVVLFENWRGKSCNLLPNQSICLDCRYYDWHSVVAYRPEVGSVFQPGSAHLVHIYGVHDFLLPG